MRRLIAWWTAEHWLIGASLTRVSLGLWAVFFYLLHWPYRGYLWGTEGIIPLSKFLELRDGPNLFSFSSSALYFQVAYLAALVVAVLVVIGLLPRLVLPLHWFMIWSMQERNFLLNDGGDNIMRIVLLFLTLTNTGAYFSVHQRRCSPAAPASGRAWDRARRFLEPTRAVVHNIGVLLIIVQLSMLYLSTGLYKVMGELWQNGTALYYILRVDEFSWPGVAELIYRNPYLVVFGTYATVLFEVTFVPALLNRWTRYLMIAAGMIFHLGIALVMGLVTFGWSMISVYPLLLTDHEYLSFTTWVREKFALSVLYDGWCPSCARSIRVLGALDLFSLVHYRSFREASVAQTYEVDIARAEQRVQARTGQGRGSEGIETMIAIALRSPFLWPLVPPLALCRLLLGQRAYDAIASRRIILVPGGCREHCLIEGSGAR